MNPKARNGNIKQLESIPLRVDFHTQQISKIKPHKPPFSVAKLCRNWKSLKDGERVEKCSVNYALLSSNGFGSQVRLPSFLSGSKILISHKGMLLDPVMLLSPRNPVDRKWKGKKNRLQSANYRHKTFLNLHAMFAKMLTTITEEKLTPQQILS